MATDYLPTGDDLRRERELKGITQAELAQVMGSTQQHVSTIESKARVKIRTAERYRKAVHAYTQDAA